MCRESAVRRGHTLVELLVALLVLTAVAAAASATFKAQSRLARSASDQSESMAALRLTFAVFSHELRALLPSRDLVAVGMDSARIRAFRGLAIVCARDSTAAHVRYAGLRLPDPMKDSMLVLSATGVENTAALSSVVAPTAPLCAARLAESVLALEPDSVLTPGDAVLLFEHGEYHLANAALRYRRGAGGRQPLTADVLVDDSSDLSLSSLLRWSAPETVAVGIRAAAGVASAPRRGPRIAALRVPVLNTAAALDSLHWP